MAWRPLRPSRDLAGRRDFTKQLDKLTHLLKKGATKFGDANAIWTSRRVRQLIKEKFEIRYSMRQVRRILRKIGWSPKKPVKRPKKYSEKAVKHFRQYLYCPSYSRRHFLLGGRSPREW
jgi:transposase